MYVCIASTTLLFYAAAYATVLCPGRSPAKIHFDENIMWTHFIKCSQDGQFTMFPVMQTSSKVTNNAAQCIPVKTVIINLHYFNYNWPWFI